MTIPFRHLSSLLRAKPAVAACPDVPGLAYYSAPEGDAPREAPVAATSPELQALEAMYGYYNVQA